MKKFGVMTFASLIVLGSMLGWGAQDAHAIKQFQDQFIAKYVKKDSSDPAEKSLADAVAKVKCNLCHDANTKSKKDRNAYGQALSELLDKMKDKNDKEKINAALEKVAGMPSDPSDNGSATFGALIAEGKVPVE